MTWTEWVKQYIPKNWLSMVFGCIVTAAMTLLVAYGCLPPGTPIPAPPLPVFEQPGEDQFGWHRDDEQVKAIQDKLEFKVFSDTPAGAAGDPIPDKVYLWQSYQKLFARGPPSKDQSSIGSCVSFGTTTACERSLATQIVFAKGGKDEFRFLSPEVIYGGSRVQVGGGRLGRSDGSVGAWAAEFVKEGKWGVVAQEKHGDIDLSTYSVPRCREYGTRGVPAPLLDIAKQRPVKDVTMIRTWAEAKRSLASGYAIAVCSNVGFEGTRDANGVKVARGSWAHCMCIDGYHTEGGVEYGHIENSWGERPNEGPVGWGDPPTSGFWAKSTTIQNMLSQGDSWAFATVKGWPTRRLNWFVEARPQQQNSIRLARLFAHQGREVQYATLP